MPSKQLLSRLTEILAEKSKLGSYDQVTQVLRLIKHYLLNAKPTGPTYQWIIQSTLPQVFLWSYTCNFYSVDYSNVIKDYSFHIEIWRNYFSFQAFSIIFEMCCSRMFKSVQKSPFPTNDSSLQICFHVVSDIISVSRGFPPSFVQNWI